MAYPHGSVVLAPATFKTGVRPYCIVSNGRRPYQGEEYTIATVTSRERDGAIELTPATLSDGRLVRYPSFVNPWGLHVVRAEQVERRVAQLSRETMKRVVQAAVGYMEPV